MAQPCIILKAGVRAPVFPHISVEVQMEAWGPRGFAVTSTGSLPGPACLELDQAEWENIPGSKQGVQIQHHPS